MGMRIGEIYTCAECQQPTEMIGYLNKPEERGLCFKCDFWMEKVRWREAGDPNAFTTMRTDMENNSMLMHYYIEPDVSGGFKGYGGQGFRVIFADGREVVTHNLWCQGEVPARFAERLAPNATLRSAT